MASRMSGKRIDERLRGNPGATKEEAGPSPYTRPGSEGEPNEGQELSTSAFAVLTLCVCAIAAASVFVWRGGYLAAALRPVPAFVSIVEACGEGWTAGMPNGKQIECYLTKDIGRLCDPRERAHLAAVFDRYAGEVIAFRSAAAVATLAALPQLKDMSANMTAANAAWGEQMRRANGSEADPLAGADAVQEVADNSLKDLEKTTAFKMIAEGSKREMDRSKMEAALQQILARGFMTPDDFGWRARSSFREQFKRAIAGAGKVKPGCRSTT